MVSYIQPPITGRKKGLVALNYCLTLSPFLLYPLFCSTPYCQWFLRTPHCMEKEGASSTELLFNIISILAVPPFLQHPVLLMVSKNPPPPITRRKKGLIALYHYLTFSYSPDPLFWSNPPPSPHYMEKEGA